MIDFFSEMMLRSYFTAEATVGRFYGDKRALFGAFARVFLLTEEETEHFYALSQAEDVAGIRSVREYHRYCRMKEYLAMNRRDDPTDPETEEVVDLKGAAFTTALTGELIHETREVRSVACETMTRAADGGLVLGLYVLGLMQMEGFVFEKDENQGLVKLRKAADWDSAEGLFTALYYDPARRDRYLVRLRERLLRLGHLDLFARVEAVYGPCDTTKHREFLLLEKAFDQRILKRELYVKSYARLIYSEILSMKDKEALVLSSNPELFAAVSTLPLKLDRTAPAADTSQLKAMRPSHPKAVQKIVCCLENLDFRTVMTYRPICLVSDSKFMLDFYAQAIADCLKQSHVEFIEVNDLTEHDFEPTMSNIFVRSCDEDVFNAYFLFFRDEIEYRVYDTAKTFLQSVNRSKLRLNNPSVVLDLSMILPVCFCDSAYAKMLQPFCDIVRLSDFTKVEKRELVECVLKSKAAAYGVKEISAVKEVGDKIAEYSVDNIEKILDLAVREHRADSLVLTQELMQPYFKGASGRRNAYGFGGSIDEDHE